MERSVDLERWMLGMDILVCGTGGSNSGCDNWRMTGRCYD